LPMVLSRRWEPPPPGIVPMVISGWPNFAVGEAKIISVARAISQPPPSCNEISQNGTVLEGMRLGTA
jgi:hypothetical protein